MSAAPRTRSRRAVLCAQALNGAACLLRNARRLALSSVTALLATTSMALGTYAGFSAQTVSPGNTFATGTVKLTATAGSPASATAFSFGTIANMVPGETVTRFLDLNNTGTLGVVVSMEACALAAGACSATGVSALDQSATDGLQLEIKRCSVPWTGIGGCAGTISTLYDDRVAPLIGTPLSLGSVSGGSVAYLQLAVTLPDTPTAGTYTNLTSTLQFTWTASSS